MSFKHPITRQIAIEALYRPQNSGSSGATGGAFKARLVATVLPANTGTGTGTLTGAGSIASQDSSTIDNGNVLFIPMGLLNTQLADVGPWTVTDNGAISGTWVITRPSWWPHGGAMIPGALSGSVVEIYGGLFWGGNSFKCFALTGTIDAGSPNFINRINRLTVTLIGRVTGEGQQITDASGFHTIGAAGDGQPIAMLATAVVEVTLNTGAGTLGTNKLAAPVAFRVANGLVGSNPAGSSLVVESLNDDGSIASSDTSTVDVLIQNW